MTESPTNNNQSVGTILRLLAVWILLGFLVINLLLLGTSSCCWDVLLIIVTVVVGRFVMFVIIRVSKSLICCALLLGIVDDSLAPFHQLVIAGHLVMLVIVRPPRQSVGVLSRLLIVAAKARLLDDINQWELGASSWFSSLLGFFNMLLLRASWSSVSRSRRTGINFTFQGPTSVAVPWEVEFLSNL